MPSASGAEALAFYDPSTITTPFGPDGDRFHWGVDVAHGDGPVAIPSPFHGMVVTNGADSPNHGHGNYLVIRLTALPDWYLSVSHMRDRSSLAEGTWLEPLELLGIEGTTGDSSANHTHVQLSTRPVPWDHSGQTIDPYPLIRAALDGRPWINAAGIAVWTNPQPPAPPAAPTAPEPIHEPPFPPTPPTPTDPAPEEEPMSDPTATRTAVTGALAEIPQVSVADGALGAVITSSADRRRIYTVWTIIGLVLQGLGAGAASALAAGFALWAALTLGVDEQVRVAVAPWVPLIVVAVGVFAFATGIYRALSPQVSSLAVANTKR